MATIITKEGKITKFKTPVIDYKMSDWIVVLFDRNLKTTVLARQFSSADRTTSFIDELRNAIYANPVNIFLVKQSGNSWFKDKQEPRISSLEIFF